MLLQLAPGGHLGRFIIWTKSAFEQLDTIFGKQDPAFCIQLSCCCSCIKSCCSVVYMSWTPSSVSKLQLLHPAVSSAHLYRIVLQCWPFVVCQGGRQSCTPDCKGSQAKSEELKKLCQFIGVYSAAVSISRFSFCGSPWH